MAQITLNQFGGLVLGTPARELPPAGGQIAHNMAAQTMGFVPVRGDGTPALLANSASFSNGARAKFLYRFPQSTVGAGQLLGAGVSGTVARGQVAGDTKERTYLASDGSVPPYVLYTDSPPTPLVRPLGVHYPVKPPTLTVNTVEQLTGDVLAGAQSSLFEQIWTLLEQQLDNRWEGVAGSTGANNRPGYVDPDGPGAYKWPAELGGAKPYQARVMCADPIDTFSTLSDDAFASWVLGVNPTYATYGASAPAWTGFTPLANKKAWVFTYKAFAQFFSLNTSAPSRAQILALKAPGLDESLISEAEWSTFESRVNALLSMNHPELAPLWQTVQRKYSYLTILLDGIAGDRAVAQLNEFLSSAAIQAKINAAYGAFAEEAWGLLHGAFSTPTVAGLTFGGNTGTDASPTLYVKGNPAASKAALVAAAKAALATGPVPGLATEGTAGLLNLLDQEKLRIYKPGGVVEPGTDRKESIWAAASKLDFGSAARKLFSAVSAEAFWDEPGLPRFDLSGVGVSPSTVLDARRDLEAALREIDTYHVGFAQRARQMLWDYLVEIGAGGRHAEVDPSGRSLYDTRCYTYTFVNAWGEESMPFLPGNPGVTATELELVEADQNDTVTVTLPAGFMTHVGAGQNITRWRLYRSNSSNTSSAFQLVTELPVATTSFTDDLRAEELQEVCPTMAWAPPPEITVGGVARYMRGLVNLPGGFLAGFLGRTVYFSEPYHAYAWPADYTHTMSYDIVGLGVFDQTLVVCTTGGPFFISGASPDGMSRLDISSNQACLSWASIAPVTGGVVFASPDGLCLASSGGVQVFLPAPLGKVGWNEWRPDLMACCEHDGVLYITYGAPDAQGGQALAGLALGSMKLVTFDLRVTALYCDRASDTLFAALPPGPTEKPSAVHVFGASSNRTAKWRGKRITLERYASFAWLVVRGDQSAAAGAATVKLYGYDVVDGVEVSTLVHQEVLTDTLPKRVAPGRFLEFEIEVESAARITSVQFASSTSELQDIT